MHAVPYWVKYFGADRDAHRLCGGIRGLYCQARYFRPGSLPLSRRFHNFVYRKWYFDELYDAIFVKPAFWLGRQFWRLGDIGTIDRFGPNGIAWVVDRSAGAAKSIQSGYLYTYALIMLLGLVAAVTYVLLLGARFVMEGLPILSLMMLVPLAGALACLFAGAAQARWIALAATLVTFVLGIALWSSYEIGGAQWQFTERAELFRGLQLRAGDRRDCAAADHAQRVPDADLHSGQLGRYHQACGVNTWRPSCSWKC